MAVETHTADDRALSRPLFSPHARASISHLVHREGVWKGSRHGVKVELRLSAQADLEGNSFTWRARIRAAAGGHEWRQGRAQSVFDALRDIELEQDREHRRNG